MCNLCCGDCAKQCCGNCTFHCKQGEEWLCENVNSDYYGLETEYGDTCDDWEVRL